MSKSMLADHLPYSSSRRYPLSLWLPSIIRIRPVSKISTISPHLVYPKVRAWDHLGFSTSFVRVPLRTHACSDQLAPLPLLPSVLVYPFSPRMQNSWPAILPGLSCCEKCCQMYPATIAATRNMAKWAHRVLWQAGL